MLIREFVANVLNKLESLPKPIPLSQDERIKRNLNFLMSEKSAVLDESHPVIVEASENEYAELINLLNAHKNADVVATNESLAAFYNLIQQRRASVKDNLESYLNCPKSLANRAYLILAEQLTQTTDISNRFTLVMPKIEPNFKR